MTPLDMLRAEFEALVDLHKGVKKGTKKKGNPEYEEVRHPTTGRVSYKKRKASAAPVERRYVLVAVDERTGATTVLTHPGKPVTHSEAVAMLDKFSPRKGRRIQLHEVTGGREVPARLPAAREMDAHDGRGRY